MRGPPLLRRLLRTVPRHFSAGVPLLCSRLVGSLLLLCLAWPGLRAACRFCADFCACLPAMRLCVRGFCCRCLACLARRAGVQGGAAARRLCVRLPAVMSAFCGFSLPAFRGVASRPACLIAAFAQTFAPVACLSVLCCVRGLFFFIFRLFLPHFCLSKIFSFVAQAATGLYFLPKRK